MAIKSEDYYLWCGRREVIAINILSVQLSAAVKNLIITAV